MIGEGPVEQAGRHEGAQRRGTTALGKIDELLAIVGPNDENLDTRGVILIRIGRLEEALKDLEEAVKVGSNGIRLYHLAQVYKKMGRDAECRKTFEEAQRAGLTATTIDPTERAELKPWSTTDRVETTPRRPVGAICYTWRWSSGRDENGDFSSFFVAPAASPDRMPLAEKVAENTLIQGCDETVLSIPARTWRCCDELPSNQQRVERLG